MATPAAETIVDLPKDAFRRDPQNGALLGVTVKAVNSTFEMLKLHDGWVDMELLFPVAGNLKTCREMFQIFGTDKYRDCYAPSFLALLKSRSAVEAEDVFVLGGETNYWHFLVDYLAKLPALCLYADHPPDVLVSRGLPSDYHHLLKLACAFLGIQTPRLREAPQRILRVRNAIVPCVSDLRLRLNVLQSFGASLQAASSQGPERIFVRRGSVDRRRIVNEQQLEQRLASLGFVAVDFGGLTMTEQVRQMGGARILVGGHGAALSNLVFGRALTDVIEFYVHQQQPFFARACQTLGINHHWVAGRADPAHQTPETAMRPDNQNYSVDADALAERIAAIVRF
jgi:capsular polysaccharide biosynthesis protein